MDQSIEWIDLDFLEKIEEEVDSHPSYVHYKSNVSKGIKYYTATKEWWVPLDEFDDMDISESTPTSRENLIYQTVNELNSLLLKNKPIVRTHPYHPADSVLSDDMDAILLAAWRSSNTQEELRTTLLMAQICGLGVCKIGWNMANKAVNAAGEVGIQFMSPEDIILDPFATNSHRGLDCRYIRHRSWQTPEAIIYRYGNEGAKALGLESPKGRAKTWGSKLHEIRKKVFDSVTGRTQEGDKVDRRIAVHEYWIFPVYGRESELSTGRMVDEKEYPYGVVVTRIGDNIVRRMGNPNYKKRKMTFGEGVNVTGRTVEVGHRMHPFVLIYWNRQIDASGYNGIYDCSGMVQEQIPIQQSVNAVGRNIEQHIRTTANPYTYAYADAFEDPIETIKRAPGDIYALNPTYGNRNISEVVRDYSGQQMSSEVFQYFMHKRDQVGYSAGLKPHMIGLAPQGTSHTPAATVGTLQEASFSAMWLRNDEITACCRDIAQRFLGLIQQHYKPGRIVEISEEGGIATYIQIEATHLSAIFKLEVVSGTTTPLYDMDKESRLMVIKQHVDAALASQNVAIMKSTLIYLDNLNNPWTYQWVQLLKQQIEELKLAEQTLAGMGGMALMGQQEQPALPPAQPGMEALAEQLGVSPEEIEAALSS